MYYVIGNGQFLGKWIFWVSFSSPVDQKEHTGGSVGIFSSSTPNLCLVVMFLDAADPARRNSASDRESISSDPPIYCRRSRMSVPGGTTRIHRIESTGLC